MEKSILQVATETLKIEIAALQNLESSLDDSFEQAVNKIFQGKGRLIITGIGKSALIAQKIVATLNSTGTPSIYMHAADAIHGDLGMLQPEDMALCISKSGETPEIKVLVPMLKNLGNQLIAIVANPASFLAKNADFTLLTPIDHEADPNNLAPTASTTSQMVMGDMIAVALMSLRGFTSQDFAKYHPGGALGKQLYLTVGDVVEASRAPHISEEDNIRSIILEITSKRYGATAVINSSGTIIGIITDGDIRRMMEKHDDVSGLKAKDIMSTNPKIISPSDLAVDALQVLRENSISQIIVREEDSYIGMIHLHDIIREGII